MIGDLNVSASEINRLLKENASDSNVLKPEAKTKPQVFYIGMTEEFTSKIQGNAVVYDVLGENI